MRFLFIVLALLLLLTRSQSFVIRDEPLSELEKFKQEVNEYLKNVNRELEDKLRLVRDSEFANVVASEITDARSSLQRWLSDLHTSFPTEVRQRLNLVTEIGHAKVACTLGEVRRKLEHATESFCVKVQSKLAPYVDPILKTVRPQIQDLHYTLIARTLDLSTKLTEKLKQRLEELDHYTETLPSQWKEINEFLVPFAGLVQQLLTQAVQISQHTLQRYMAPLLEADEKYVKDFKRRADECLFPQDQ